MAQWPKVQALGEITMEEGTWPGEVTPPNRVMQNIFPWELVVIPETFTSGRDRKNSLLL